MKSLGNKKDLVPFVVNRVISIRGGIKKVIKSVVIDSFLNSGCPRKVQWDRSVIEKELKSAKGIQVSDLKYVDMIFSPDYCNGIYIFYKGETCAYIGKNSSRSIVERIGGHLAPRDWDYMNVILKRVLKATGYSKQKWDDVLKELYDEVLGMTIKYIPVLKKDSIGTFEARMIEMFKPLYNH